MVALRRDRSCCHDALERFWELFRFGTVDQAELKNGIAHECDEMCFGYMHALGNHANDLRIAYYKPYHIRQVKS